MEKLTSQPKEQGKGLPGAKPDLLEIVSKGMGLKSVEELKERFSSTKKRSEFLAGILSDEKVMTYANENGLKTADVKEGLDTLAKTYESKESFMQRSWNFLKRNKWKILGGAAAIGAGVAAYYYWPAVSAFAVTAKESVRSWLIDFLGVPKMPDMPALPNGPSIPPIPEMPGVPTPPPPSIPSIPGRGPLDLA